MRSSSLLRIGLPAVIALAGAVVLLAGSDVVGLALLAVAVTTVAANWWIRLAIGSEHDREDEARARERFSRTGRWPDE